MESGFLVPRHVLIEEMNKQLTEQADEMREENRHWESELKRIDPSLSLVWAPAGADPAVFVPERWHIKKRVPGSLDAYIPLVGPDNEYRAPGGWMLDFLESADMWNPRVHRDRKEAKEKMREAKRRAKAREAEQSEDEMRMAVRAAKRVRGDGGMTRRTDRKGERPPKVKPPA